MNEAQFKLVHRLVLLSTQGVPGLADAQTASHEPPALGPATGSPPQPRILARFPEMDGVTLPKHFEEFCYPDLEAYTQPHLEPLQHVFVLTEGDGRRLFGVCRRMWSLNGPPLCIVILSYFAIFDALFALLGFVATHMNQSSMQSIYACLDSLSLAPNLAQVDTVPLLIPNSKLDIQYLAGHFVIPGNMNVSTVGEPLLSCLSADTILLIIALIMTERRIIFTSSSVQNLSLSILGITSLLAPFSWQFIFVPVLPRSLQAYCSAPMPFLIGIHKSALEDVQRLPLEEVVFMDLDTGECTCDVDAYSHLLPPHLTAKVHTALSRAGMRIGESTVDTEKVIRSEFTRMFLSLLGNYLWFVRPNNGNPQAAHALPNGVKSPRGSTNPALSASGSVVASHVTDDFLFEKEYFLRSVSDFDTRELLKVLMQSQMFDEFMMERYRALKENRTIESEFDREAQRMRMEGPAPTIDADLSLTSTVSYVKSLGRSWTKNIKMSLGDWQQKMNKWEFRSEWAPSIYKSVASAVGKGDVKAHPSTTIHALDKRPNVPLKKSTADPILGPYSDSEPYSDATPPVPSRYTQGAVSEVFSTSNRPVILPRMSISTPLETSKPSAFRLVPPPPQRHRSKGRSAIEDYDSSNALSQPPLGVSAGPRPARKNPFATPPLAQVSHTLIDLSAPPISTQSAEKTSTPWTPFGVESPQRRGSLSAYSSAPAPASPAPISLLDDDLNDPFLAISQRSKPH